MPNLLVPRPWTSQPQFATGINLANPITRGLTSAYSGATLGYNAATGVVDPLTFGGSGVVQRAVPGGISLYTPHGGWAVFSQGADWSGPNTIVTLAIVRGAQNPYGAFLSKNTSGTTSQFGIGRDAGNDAIYGAVDNSTASQHANSHISTIINIPSVLAFSHSGAPSTPSSYFLNGAFVGASNNLATQPSGTGSLYLGCDRTFVSTYDSDVDWLLFLRYNRVLSAAEIASISANPWQIFRPALC